MLEKDFTKCTGCKECVEFIMNGDDVAAVMACQNGALKIKNNEENSSLKGEE